eukprot:COSAG06_NODE_26863_length_606_cov_0.741617_1_plen_137_part_10
MPLRAGACNAHDVYGCVVCGGGLTRRASPVAQAPSATRLFAHDDVSPPWSSASPRVSEDTSPTPRYDSPAARLSLVKQFDEAVPPPSPPPLAAGAGSAGQLPNPDGGVARTPADMLYPDVHAGAASTAQPSVEGWSL